MTYPKTGFSLICLVLAALLASCVDTTGSSPAAGTVELEPTATNLFEDLSVELSPQADVDPKDATLIDDPDARDGKAAALYREGEGVKFKLDTIRDGKYKISVRARGDLYKGPPILRLSVNEKQVGTDNAVRTDFYKEQNFGEFTLKQGQVLEAVFTNDDWGGSPDKDRNLYIDYLTLTPVGGATPPAPPEPGPGTATGQFYVVGKDIIDPDGNIFYPIGANAAIKFTPYDYVFEGGNGGINDRLENVKAWNWNTIRATLVCDNTTPSFDELVNGIAPTIKRFTSAKIVVMLECVDGTAKNPRVGDPVDLKVRKFWDEMTRRYKDNPYVWFNIYNEPYNNDDTKNWGDLHEFYVERIRSRGAENLIVVDVPENGQGVQLLTERSDADELAQSCNVLFSWHAYGVVGDGSVAAHRRALEGVQAKDYALIIGEVGVPVPVGNDAQYPGSYEKNVQGFEAIRRLAPDYGVGVLWWHATGDTSVESIYALKKDGSGFWTAGNSGNLTPFGQKFYNLSQSVSQTRGAFQSDLAASNCKSAGATSPTPEQDPDPEPQPDSQPQPGQGAAEPGFGPININDYLTDNPSINYSGGDPGAFRTVCNFSHFNYDDPVVSPDQPGASHLHMYWGNTAADASTTTYNKITSRGEGTCQGGILNRSGYWMPALIDKQNNARIPQYLEIYYKNGALDASNLNPFPNDFRFIAGNGMATSPQPKRDFSAVNQAPGALDYTWHCGAALTFPEYFPYAESQVIPDCPAGSFLTLTLVFPQCWDGKDLGYKGDHKSHVAYSYYTGSGGACPPSHPIGLPEITYNVYWNNSDVSTAGWALASDKMMGVPGGTTTHADWLGGWQPDVLKTLVEECVKAPYDCQGGTISETKRLAEQKGGPNPGNIYDRDAPARKVAVNSIPR